MSNVCPLEFVREDDFVEYFLFPQLQNNNSNDEDGCNSLEKVLQQINEFIDRQTADYIWHKDRFHLSVRTDAHQILIEDDNTKEVSLPPHLYGITHYGDNIQDEWFLVYLLFEITRQFPGIIGRIVDSDGEFLLIEAADVLPKWASPESCEQRVYIYDGHLQLVQNSPSNTASVLPVSAAIAKITQNPKLYRVSNEIQNCLNERLTKFEEEKSTSVHCQTVRVPLGVAAILNNNASLIAPACRAFCERDPIDMKVCRAMRFFPPEDRVRTNVKFTRCLYAMISHTNYTPDKRVGWDLPVVGTDEYKEDILGVKIACGFEILASQAKDDDDLENDRSWRAYLKNLQGKGYFKDNIEGSSDYVRLTNEAKEFFKENRSRFRTSPLVGKEIVNLLRSIDINADQFRDAENNLKPSDNDNWLNITSDQLDEMLTAKYGVNKLYTPSGGINAQEFTDNITDFLDKKSEFDGIDMEAPVPPPRTKKNAAAKEQQSSSNSQKSTSDQINFDPDAFTTHVKNLLDFVIPEDNWDSNSDMSDYEDDDDLEKNIEDMTNTKMTIEKDIKTYMSQMDKELSSTTMGKSFEREKKATTNGHDDFDDIETFEPIDIDVNTLKNMMDSYKSQIGGPGPTSNLLTAMGIGMETNGTAADDEHRDLSESTV